ncbi:M1 family metallopeptidase [Rhodocytophaga rosea]|uniref:M1 family metallopeptidase n=1 Tax=Rhodocytophaga rosea TaxID=2704465 RepID=A0A6C0GMH4_9BACT|nr:M1 family metallopeptidase [Rhodocytophaga rosea]QHT69137.1 M1 family metallopeptidase [Rhodocytophaga rosea]
MKRIFIWIFALVVFKAVAQQEYQPANSKFEQLGTMLPTPNSYRSASGVPGPDYWQQKADYDIKVELNDEKQHITGSEVITYTNFSPDELTYLWVQLDQNLFSKDSDTYKTETGTLSESMSFDKLNFVTREAFDGGYKITSVREKSGGKLKYTINKTMMRVDLPKPLKPNSTFSFAIDWNYNINDQKKLGGRTGFEYFPKDKNYLYEIAQWFPRMAVYDDVYGWQHKQFLGQGEFALPFGDYKVAITVPSDHIVAATGELQNSAQVLSKAQLSRIEKAKNSKDPVVIVTQAEAEQAEKGKPTGKKTWIYAAKNVRDFAWASSRKFIWDAKQVNIAGKKVWAMSYYPKEGNPLWGQYSTRVVEHTLRVYSEHTIDYPYPVAISVHGPVFGMEYPMICFNGGRPESDGTYSEQTKYAMISVIIHEVGHNFFPMIVNSDERQWSWMDEGLNSFCQFLAEQEWQRNYPSRRGEPYKIVPYMKSAPSALVPIMTNSEQIMQFGANAYGKPATGLNILRETIMGRELFDYAFKEYARRWAFKHPHPADFFRTMEDASSVDLDWFWRGWFYSTNPVEISLEDVQSYTINTRNPEVEKPLAKASANPKTYSQMQNEKMLDSTLLEKNPSIADFYNSYDPNQVTAEDKARYEKYYNSLTAEEKALVDSGLNFYVLNFKNNGGLIMPLIIKMDFADGTDQVVRIPAEVWRLNNTQVNKVIFTEKPVIQFTLDPYLETADIDTENNSFPRKPSPSRFQLFKQQQVAPKNPMQQKEAAGQMNRK